MAENINVSLKEPDLSTKDSVDSLQKVLQGTTFKIYWYLLTHGETGIRQIQRELGLSSSNLVNHHLKKLISVELVAQNLSTEKYEVKKEITTGLLSLYTRFGNFLIPQNVFLLAFFFSMSVCYLIFILIPRGNIVKEDVFFFAISIIGMVFFIRQTLKIWRLSPL
ncbi:MAG: hypothetical protein ACFFAU_05375 [Candidatus Hodarchaeota archaeon]